MNHSGDTTRKSSSSTRVLPHSLIAPSFPFPMPNDPQERGGDERRGDNDDWDKLTSDEITRCDK